MARFGNAAGGDAGAELSPTTMRGREPLQAIVVAVILVGVGVADLLVTKGKGAPKHPTLWYAYVGIALAIFLVVSLRWRNRILSPFAAIFGAFFVTLAQSPSSLEVPHLVALVGSVAFAITVSMRQRKEQKALAPPRARPARRRKGQPEPEPEPVTRRPAASRRYTPPKAQIEAEKARRSGRR